ncbi:YpbS family protein [Peribacillus acanthi]|uniref:YpbS family protein n=1 Tax=Peribacillus acanthi TaxID=2171554 RepID=UPI000D3E775C|nr:YpbS family protein [Peribacillus acanthi]
MSVHKAISKHVNGQNEIIRHFAYLDEQRERFIEEATTLCKNGQPFSTDLINAVTKEMNELSMKIENLPSRKLVTQEMIKDYVNLLEQ